MKVTASEEIEEIKKLKARYFRWVDQKQWDEWGQLFTQDATAVYHGPHPELRYHGRAQIVAETSAALADAVTVHHGHMPEVELTGPTTARGIWAMFDYVRMPGLEFRGFGHYEEEYVKEDGRWKISSLRLTRLHLEVDRGGPTSEPRG